MFASHIVQQIVWWNEKLWLTVGTAGGVEDEKPWGETGVLCFWKKNLKSLNCDKQVEWTILLACW